MSPPTEWGSQRVVACGRRVNGAAGEPGAGRADGRCIHVQERAGLEAVRPRASQTHSFRNVCTSDSAAVEAKGIASPLGSIPTAIGIGGVFVARDA